VKLATCIPNILHVDKALIDARVMPVQRGATVT